MRKKGLSVMLCAAMAASLLAGCGGGNKPAETTAAPAAAEPAPTSYSSEEPASAGTLASDEALAELRKKLTGN